MKYASGNEMTRHRTVAAAAYPNDRWSWLVYSEIESGYTDQLNVWLNPVSALPVCSETHSWLTTGTAKNTTSHSTPGASRTYGSSARRRRSVSTPPLKPP